MLQRNYRLILDNNDKTVLSKPDLILLGFTPNFVFRVNF